MKYRIYSTVDLSVVLLNTTNITSLVELKQTLCNNSNEGFTGYCENYIIHNNHRCIIEYI